MRKFSFFRPSCTLSVPSCEEIRAVAKKLGRKIFVCHVLRYADFFSTIKRELDTGAYGEISTVNATENVADRKSVV